MGWVVSKKIYSVIIKHPVELGPIGAEYLNIAIHLENRTVVQDIPPEGELKGIFGIMKDLSVRDLS